MLDPNVTLRDYNVDGVPSSLAYKPKKSELRQMFSELQASALAFTDFSGASPVFYAALFGVSTTNTAAANTTALNACIASCIAAGGGKIILPRGTIPLNPLATIVGANGLVLVGQGLYAGGTTLSCAAATGDFMTFNGCQYSGIVDCYITASVRRTGNWAIVHKGGSFHPMVRARIDYHYDGVLIYGASEAELDMQFRYMYGDTNFLITGTSASRTYGVTALIRSDNPYPVTGDAPRKTWSNGLAVSANDIVYSPTSGMIYQVIAGGALGTTEPNTIGGSGAADGFTTAITSGTATLKFVSRALCHARIGEYAYSIRFAQGSHMLNGLYGVVIDDATNSADSRPKWIYLDETEVDHTHSHGVWAYRGESLYLRSAWVGSSLTGIGVLVDSGFAKDVSFDPGCRIAGHWQHGVYLAAGPTNVRVSGATVEDNSQAGTGTYHGIMVNGATRWQIHGSTLQGAKQGYGLHIASGSDYYAVVGNSVGGNATGGINNVPGASANRREIQSNIS